MEIAIRPAKVRDVSSIRSLMADVLETSLQGGPLDPKAMLENANKNLDFWLEARGKCVHLVASDQGDIVGVVLIKNYWNFVSLFVKADFQRKGIGSLLTRAGLELCRGKCRSVCLNASDASTEFYEKMGFVRGAEHQMEFRGVTPMKIDL